VVARRICVAVLTHILDHWHQHGRGRSVANVPALLNEVAAILDECPADSDGGGDGC
jgi:hypothetical protein